VEQETRRFKAERAAEPIVFRERSPDQRPRSVVPSQERLTDRGEHQIRMRATGSSKRASPSGWRAGSVEPTSTDEPSGCCHARARAAVEFEPSARLQLYCAKRCQVAPAVTAPAPLPARPACRRCWGRLGWWQRSDAA
jgi:hypothetical protein